MRTRRCFPISTGVFETWFPVGHWGFPNGLQTAGLDFGSAAATPLIAVLMQSYGWKNALLWTAVPTIALVALWNWYGRDSPAQHPRVSAEELAELDANATGHPAAGINRRDFAPGAGQQGHLAARHFVHDHELRVLPAEHLVFPVPGAGAALVDSGKRMAGEPSVHRRRSGRGHRRQALRSLAARYGLGIGYRAVPVVTLPLAGLLLFVGVESSNPYLAVGALSLAFAGIEITEAAYSAATTAVAREHTMTGLGRWWGPGGISGV